MPQQPGAAKSPGCFCNAAERLCVCVRVLEQGAHGEPESHARLNLAPIIRQCGHPRHHSELDSAGLKLLKQETNSLENVLLVKHSYFTSLPASPYRATSPDGRKPQAGCPLSIRLTRVCCLMIIPLLDFTLLAPMRLPLPE